MDIHENLYIADSNANKVRMVTRANIITTYAGVGTSGSSGDNDAATSAQLNQPQGVAVDMISGYVYIADTGNGRIRVVNNNTGTITTFAGNYSSNNYYDCAATSARLFNPTVVAVDRVGNVYIGTGIQYTWNNNQVLFVARGSGFLTLLAGSGAYFNSPPTYDGPATSALLYYPSGIAIDVDLNVYIATTSQSQTNNQVLVVAHNTSIITVFAGIGGYNNYVFNNGDGGLATNAALRSPSGVAVDIDGNVFISDQGNSNVRMVTAGTGIISTYVGGGNGALGDGGSATSASLNYPGGLAVDSKGYNLYIADKNNYRVRKVTNMFNNPTKQPSSAPSSVPSHPSGQPSSRPSMFPSNQPTSNPSIFVWQPKLQVCVMSCWL